jgi:hypothetical protein
VLAPGLWYSVSMVKKAYPINEEHKRIVEAGGGIYVPGMMGDVVLFNGAYNNTLGLHEKDLNPEAVRAKVLDSNAAFEAARRRKEAA